MDFNQVEENIREYWETNNIKKKLQESRQDAPKWEFLDGPPFVNGTPHMGHLLVSTIKDTMARYMSMKGYNISYMIGFDCHGLPLEQEAEKVVGKVSPQDDNDKIKIFNDTCRNIVSNCSDKWFQILERLGRQFNKDETYYTSSFDYMQTLWWAFGKLYEMGLIYKSKKVMPYSPLCETPLSNFEATSNYMERTDVSIYIKFPIKNSSESLLIFTTTPWSLFANQGVCVNPTLDYVLICDTEYSNKLWLEKSCFEKLFPNSEEYKIITTKKGEELVGIEYEPIFPLSCYDEYMTMRQSWTFKVYSDNYVDNSGTGIVHLAPLFGADDMRVLKNNNYTDNLLPEYLVDTMVRFKINYNINGKNIRGEFVIDLSTDIVIHLKKMNLIHKSEKIKHSYPHCWRTDGPLIYLATDAWFLNVQSIIPDMIENNTHINWSPEFVGKERFANWIKGSPDWCLSRNRVWGTPIPIWISDSGRMICIKSVKELEQYTGNMYTDLHLDSLNNVTFEVNKETYRRTFGTLDCWFESGMAGLSRHGYPECKEKSYPVDFIAESLDQTRGWFYVLNVLSTALCGTPAYKNVIVSGLILAEDGKKMSKRLMNYTDPTNLITLYGADILRLYLISSPASKAESFCFKDSDLIEIRRKLLPYYNAHLLLIDSSKFISASKNMDKTKCDIWIENKFIEFAKQVYKNMEKLEITQIPNLIYKFIDTLCNVYVRLSKDRLKEYCGSNIVLHDILRRTNILLAPFMPHLAEHFNQMLGANDSIHLETIDINYINTFELDQNVLDGFYSVNEVLESGRNMRLQIAQTNIYPINSAILYTDNNNISEYSDVICKELNIKSLLLQPPDKLPKLYRPNKMLLCKTYKKDASQYIEMIEKGSIDMIDPVYYSVEYNVETKQDFIGSTFNYIDMNGTKKQAILYISTILTQDNYTEAETNNIRKQINMKRKELGLKMYNIIQVIFEEDSFWANIQLKVLEQKIAAEIVFDILVEYDTILLLNGTKLKFHIKMK